MPTLREVLPIGKNGRFILLGLTLFILATVLGMGWFQYQQVARVSNSESSGYNNFVWEFFELEHHLLKYRLALRESQSDLADMAKLEDASNAYNIFASQVLLINRSTAADPLLDKRVFIETMEMAAAYVRQTDLLLESVPKNITKLQIEEALDGSEQLGEQIHRLVLAAHEFQSQRSRGKLKEIRVFATYGGITAFFLLALSLASGLVAVRQLAKASERQEALELLHQESSHRASHDPLTGLVNRSEFEKHLRRALDSARKKDLLHALIFIDLDRFKIVNDTCGHSAGDQLLKEVVAVIASCTRSTDVFGRLGGDEFGMILSGCDPSQASTVAENIRRTVDDFRFDYMSRRFHIGASIGWVTVHSGWSDTAVILQAADSACYVAKNSGRNRVHAFEEDDVAVQAKREETLWAQRIEEALERNKFELHWQQIFPIQAEDDGESEGVRCEILLRMVDDSGALLSPAEFVPIAEKFFIASRIDIWVVQNVLRWMAEHSDHLQDLKKISINLSGVSIGDAKFREKLLQILNASSVRCEKLCFEVTETAVIANIEDCIPFLKALRQKGASISLDDFGSGLSSFAYLKILPADELKIDGKFIQNILRDQVDRVSARYMAELAKANGMKTVAEWVDSPEVVELLRDFGIHFVQGYLFHKPEPLHGLMAAIRAKRSILQETVAY
jgi:diguanylate cyclase (GGDEF)-like protein